MCRSEPKTNVGNIITMEMLGIFSILVLVFFGFSKKEAQK